MTTLARLQALLAQDLGKELESIEPSATLESLEVDSLRMIELVFSIEEAFGITVTAEPAEIRARVQTLGDLAAYVDELLAAKTMAAE